MTLSPVILTMNDTPTKETQESQPSTTSSAPRRSSIVTICMAGGLVVGIIVGFVLVPKAVALAMFFGAAFGAGLGAAIDASRNKNR